MFQLPFEIKPSSFKISIKDQIILMGSCFAENIGQKLIGYKFKCLTNPTGVIYNPISLFKLLETAIHKNVDQKRVIKNGEIFYHWDAHSTVSANAKDKLIESYIARLQATKSTIQSAKVLIVTFGSSWVYRHQSSDAIVANCHKIPQKEFTKSILSVNQIVDSYQEAIRSVRSINPELHIIFTVSPVRHIKDGLAQNNLSKSVLIQAVNEIVNIDKKASYFPSYELIIDVLRDYRFFKEDMVHPTDQAIQYVWKEFVNVYFDQQTRDFILEWDKILKDINHRPFHPESAAHQIFLKSLVNKLKSYQDVVDISTELKKTEDQLIVS
ncbi:MAG: GSCFA domain-containing protein [Bacteroidota bacterium]